MINHEVLSTACNAVQEVRIASDNCAAFHAVLTWDTIDAMRRRIVLIAVLLFAGAIVNVAVAWGFTFRDFSKKSEWTTLSVRDVQWWRHNAPIGFAETPTESFQQTVFGATLDEIGHSVNVGDGKFINMYAHRFRFGWPCRSFEGSRWQDNQLASYRRDFAKIQLFRHSVPTRILWPGFAVNTMFCAAALWLMYFTAGSMRRMLRRRRGLCPACAYPIGTSPVCTECGKPVMSTA